MIKTEWRPHYLSLCSFYFYLSLRAYYSKDVFSLCELATNAILFELILFAVFLQCLWPVSLFFPIFFFSFFFSSYVFSFFSKQVNVYYVVA
jgi:hypothetical protein